MKISSGKTSVWFYIWSILLMLGCCWAFLQWNHPLADRARMQVEAVVQQPVNWHVLRDWYSKYVDSKPVIAPEVKNDPQSSQQVSGTILSFEVPVKGQVWLPFLSDRQGIIIKSYDNGTVRNVADGRVVHADEFPGIGRTIVVQHSNGVQSWYGLLENTQLRKNEWVVAGELIGRGSEDSTGHDTYVFFAIKDGEQFRNPLDVVKIE